MQSQTSKKVINIKTKTKDHSLDLTEYARWLSLIEGIELVIKKAQQMKLDNNKDFDWIKPLAFQKYIAERTESMVDEIEIFEKDSTNEINTFPITTCTTSSVPSLK